jgi:quercetin dioxygenase-like cupin family protein
MYMHFQNFILMVAAITGAEGATNIDVPSRPVGTTRLDLQRHDLSIPNREAWQLRVAFAPGASFPRHRHPGEEIIYVLNGTIEYQLDGRPPVTLRTGDVLFVPYGAVHAAKNVGSTEAAELGTYVVEKGKPLTEIVK